MNGRPRIVTMATAVALAGLPTAARAAETTGNELWSLCTSKGATENSLCFGYVTAIAEAIGQPTGVYGWRACFPEQVTRKQVVDVVTRYLDQHPEERHLTAGSLIANALAKAFRCKQ
jgi:hypothetical protein